MSFIAPLHEPNKNRHAATATSLGTTKKFHGPHIVNRDEEMACHKSATSECVIEDDDEQNKTTRRSTLFAERDGHTLKFENLVMTTRTKSPKTRPPKKILKNISGHVPPRMVTAIMGHSGSGKTSLLKILTGRVGKKVFDISGEVKLDGRLVDPTNIEVRREIAYVEQEVSIPATSTPREAIRFSARLRLDRSVSKNDIELLVEEILSELGLSACADTIIGGGVLLPGGLSGGEKKRTQCGVELVTKPGIIILDEPTSGLDSFSAEQLMDVLKRIARVGAGVLVTIHQPPPTVVRKIDHIILLLAGRLMYDGSPGDQLLDYFAQKGFPKPVDYNIADWIMVSDADIRRGAAIVGGGKF
jgi:ABC-type multidrug transport system ATPase subunit